VSCPALVIGYTADTSVYPGDLAAIADALAGPVERVDVRGDHYGVRPGDVSARSGAAEACEAMTGWLVRRTGGS
jgi:hypothetical protein